MAKLATVITQTPFRVSFFGGGTDFPPFFNRFGGSVLGTSIDKFLYVSMNSLERLMEKKIRISYSRLELANLPEELEHELAREVLIKHKDMLNDGFIDVNTFADLPYSSGMGSSSSFTVGFLNAFYLAHNQYRTPKQIAREAIEVERDILQNAGGWQDQIHAAYGGFNRIDFADNKFSVTPVCLSKNKLDYLEENCMLFFTGLVRESANIQEKMFKQENEANTVNKDEIPEEKIELLKKLKTMVDEGVSILSNSTSNREMLKEFGHQLHQAWKYKSALSNKVSSGKMEQIYETAIKAGAYGGKLLGAGGGGFFLFIVPPEKRENVSAKLSQLKKIDIKFNNDGSRPIFAD